MNLFCSHLTATLNLLMLGNVGTLRAASALFIVLGRCTQRPYRASAFDFIVEFAIARHSLNKFNSALAYTQISLTRSFPFSVYLQCRPVRSNSGSIGLEPLRRP